MTLRCESDVVTAAIIGIIFPGDELLLFQQIKDAGHGGRILERLPGNFKLALCATGLKGL